MSYKRILVYRVEKAGNDKEYRRLTASFDNLLEAIAFVNGSYVDAQHVLIDVENIDEGDMTGHAQRLARHAAGSPA